MSTGHSRLRRVDYTTLPPPLTSPPRVYVPMLMCPWLLQACHATTSCHLGVSRTLSMLMRFYWWISMDISTRWWLRRASSARRARRRAKQFVDLPFPCSYRTAPASSSALTILALYLSHPGATPTYSFSPTVSATTPTCTPLLRLSNRTRHSRHPSRPLHPSVGIALFSYFPTMAFSSAPNSPASSTSA